MRVIIQNDYGHLSLWAARYIAQRIRRFAPTADRPFVLGLPTGSSPLGTYKELIRLHREESLSFEHVVTFNMDEYVGLGRDHEQSYHTFMWKHFFSHIDIKKEHVHIPNGMAPDLRPSALSRRPSPPIVASSSLWAALAAMDTSPSTNRSPVSS